MTEENEKAAPSAPTKPRIRQFLERARPVAWGLSVGLALFVSICYALRPDACAAVTVWPVWAWAIPGLLLAALTYTRARKRPFILAALLWALYLVVFAEEPRSLIRFHAWPDAEWEAARQRGQAIRVVTLNCAGGSKVAAEEVAPFQPDLVLLTESPNARDVAEIAQKLYGGEAGVLVGLDDSLIAHGQVIPVKLPRRSGFFVEARVRFHSGPELEAISLRLMTPPFRPEFWNPATWQSYMDSRTAQRSQMRAIMERIGALPDSVPIIAAGDFNAPQGDAIFRLLPPRLHDTFAEAGVGWGDTIINEIPVLRIDQIWASNHFRAVTVFARRTVNSDHRMVVCDLLLSQPRTPTAQNSR